MGAEQRENIQFALYVQRHPCLYDHTTKAYSNRYETDKAWREVAEEFQISVRRCKEKWKNIRTVFRRHHFGAGGRKEYYMTDVLQFLVPLLRDTPKYSSGSVQTLIQNGEDQENFVHVSDNDETLSELPYEEQDNDATEFAEISYDIPNHSVDSNIRVIEESTRKQLGKRKANSLLDDVIFKYIKLKTKPSDENKPETDFDDPSQSEAQSDEHFLLSLKKDMSEMNSRQKRSFKKRIFDLIDQVLVENPAGTQGT